MTQNQRLEAITFTLLSMYVPHFPQRTSHILLALTYLVITTRIKQNKNPPSLACLQERVEAQKKKTICASKTNIQLLTTTKFIF